MITLTPRPPTGTASRTPRPVTGPVSAGLSRLTAAVDAPAWFVLTAFVLCVFLGRSTLLAQAHAPRESLKAVDLDGRLHRFGNGDGTRAIVVAFLSTQCPISNGYLPAFNRLHSKYRSSGVEFYGIVSDASVTRAEAIEHRAEFKIEFPVLFDGSGGLRLALCPTHTPQVFVLTRFGKPMYSGAVDDRWVQVGRKKEASKKEYLENAIQCVLSGRPIDVPKTKPIGCLIEDPPNRTETGEVTYTRDIAPIIQANCVSCHRPGQSGPFPLMTYEDVSDHARQIVEVTESRFMPPWKPAPGYTRFLNEQRLSKHELSLLEAWLDDEKPEGDPEDLPIPVKHVEGWPLGEPDLVLEMPEEFSIPARGADIRQYFVIPTHLSEDRLVSAIDFRPGTPQSVHHASFFLDTEQIGRRLDAADPGPGYSGFGGPRFVPNGTLSSWFPGMSARRLPNGMGRRVPKQSDLIVEVHYVPTGKRETDRSKVGVYFAKPSAKQVVTELQVGSKRLEIPGGERRHHERAFYVLPVDTILFDMVPHMHLLGREMKVWVESPDGRARPLMWIKDWDFNWQGQYAFARPIRLRKGTRIVVDAWYDNSEDNPLNPNSPPKTVRWGDNSTDEMLICNFQCTCATAEELDQLAQHQKRYIEGSRTR